MYIKDQNESLSDFFVAETDESKSLSLEEAIREKQKNQFIMQL